MTCWWLYCEDGERGPFRRHVGLGFEILSLYSKFPRSAVLLALYSRKIIASQSAFQCFRSQRFDDSPSPLACADAELKASRTISSIRATTSSGRCEYILRLFDDSFPLFDCTMRMSADRSGRGRLSSPFSYSNAASNPLSQCNSRGNSVLTASMSMRCRKRTSAVASKNR